MTPTQHILDYNGFYALNLSYDPQKQRLKVSVANRGHPWPRFVDNVTSLLRLADGNSLKKPTREGHVVTFNNVTRGFKLHLGKEFITEYSIDPKGQLSLEDRRRLTVDETRRIGNFYECEPYPQRRPEMSWEDNQALLRTAKSAIFTDFHTHSSGQISARGLMNAAMTLKLPNGKPAPYHYPISLLKDAGISTDYKKSIPRTARKMIPHIRFRPKELPEEIGLTEVEGADLHALSSVDIDKLIARMSVPADRQSTFKHVEYDGNRFRYPLSKDPRLTKAIRKEEAKEYHAQGVKMALTSFVGIDDPHILRTLHEVASEAEANHDETDFTQRFMIGIPRNLSTAEMEVALERAKIMLDSPYIVGIDILGYEANKTKEFVELLDKFAEWANEHKYGAFIRVHAGENDKNHDNVKDFLKIAVKYPNLNYLVGHGVYGMDEETTKLAKRLCKRGQEQLTLEFNPSSNIALNNINCVTQIPFTTALEHGLPFIVGSDSAGMYHTDATQLGLAAYYAGLDARGFEILKANQHHVMHKVNAYSQSVANRIPSWQTAAGKGGHIEGILARLAEKPMCAPPPSAKVTQTAIDAKLRTDQVSLIEPQENPGELLGKIPITLIGASGTSWKRLPPKQQRENAIAVDMLIHALGDNCHLVQGRNKRSGLSKIINKSLASTNKERKHEEHPELFNVGMLVDRSFNLHDSYTHLSHMIHVPGNPLDLADTIVDYTFDHDGVLIAAAGAAYTADTITEADQRGIHAKHPDNRKMMLLLNQGGASAEKAAVLHRDYRVLDGRQLVKKLLEKRPDLFPPEFKAADINALYNASLERVKSYGINEAEPIVTGAKTLQRGSPAKTSINPLRRIP